MRNKAVTKAYYAKLGFEDISAEDYHEYLLLACDGQELHFFLYSELDITQNDGQVYLRVSDIKNLYKTIVDKAVTIHPNAPLQLKSWCMWEFALLDPDHNLLTFGEEQDPNDN
jgi:hypothetical protein